MWQRHHVAGDLQPRWYVPNAGLSIRTAAIPRPVAFTDVEKTFVSEASVYRTLKAEGLVTSLAFIVMMAADAFANPTTTINQLWQTDFTYLKVIGLPLHGARRLLPLHRCLEDLHHDEHRRRYRHARADFASAGLDQAEAGRRPRLLSDNGPSYLASDLSEWLQAQGMRHTRGKPYHPMTQGKIERRHLSLKSRILLENYYLPGDLERAVDDFVEHYNHRRYHESLDNLTPADVYFGQDDRIRKRRDQIKQRTIEHRRRQHSSMSFNQMGPALSWISPSTGPKTLTTDNPYAPHRQQAYEPVCVGGRPLVRLQQIAQRSGLQQLVNETVELARGAVF